MDKNNIKELLDMGFKLSTGFDGKNSYPTLEIHFNGTYELWITCSEHGVTLEGIDFTRYLNIESVNEIRLFIKMLKESEYEVK